MLGFPRKGLSFEMFFSEEVLQKYFKLRGGVLLTFKCHLHKITLSEIFSQIKKYILGPTIATYLVIKHAFKLIIEAIAKISMQYTVRPIRPIREVSLYG